MPEQDNNSYNVVADFFRIAQSDVRLSATHISLYFVLFGQWLRNKSQSPFPITRKSVMALSKIKSTATYHKCISDLHSFGYLRYSPSYHPTYGSAIVLNIQNAKDVSLDIKNI